MKSKTLGTTLLILFMVFTLTFAAGCEKEEEPKKEDNTPSETDKKDTDKKDTDKKDTDKKDTDKKDDGKKDTDKKDDNKNSGSKSTKKLLKRNGVEWKENTKINSHVGAKQYKVVWGDTLSLIARTWKVNCYRLARYNGIKNIDLIEVGQIIKNPAAK